MGLSNLPPGVTEGMIPGNRPEDIAWEKLHNDIDELPFDEARRRFDVWADLLRVAKTARDGLTPYQRKSEIGKEIDAVIAKADGKD